MSPIRAPGWGVRGSVGLGKGCLVVGPASPAWYQPASPVPEINSPAGSVLGFILCSNRCEHPCSVLVVMYDTAYNRLLPEPRKKQLFHWFF